VPGPSRRRSAWARRKPARSSPGSTSPE
jgi:hypothetical protein